MNNTIYIIIIIFVIIFLVKLFTIRKSEHLTQTSDEAIQNLASLYNKDKLTVTNLTVPESANLNNAIINTITATNLTVPGNANINNAKITTINGRNIFAELDDLRVNVVFPVPWDQSKWVKHIQDNNYFNRNMPDGTIRSFLFVHPGGND
ncbi:MAG: hypothetical protein MUO21_02135, partial [Nitrososphaeraceae archaeon]|nr:hypothetical protein [Nitrososphaeraceae archaeon]